MTYSCVGCAEEFETLTRKRLHECSEGAAYGDDPDAIDADLDVSDDTPDDMAERVTGELLTCDVCGAKSDGCESVERTMNDRGLALAVHFDCTTCGATNENSAVLE